MILLDKPLISDFVKQSIRNGHISALDTGNVIEPGNVPLLNEEEVVKRMKESPNINLHTTSENALGWVYKHLDFTELPEKINLFKDKVVFRKLIADIFPDFFFKEVNVNKLDELNINEFPLPFIIKPSVGFFSMGVHKVFNEESWQTVKLKIKREVEEIKSVYPKEVLSLESFIIEECIQGTEYAFDAYFDDDGKAVVLGVLKHPFSGEGDVSDRVYITSKSIVRKNLQAFDDFLAKLGERANLKNFSLHTEVRIDEQGNLVPIEVNPLRFGAWCTSADLTHFAFGFNPYIYYINKLKPDWDQILSTSNDDIFSIIILDNSTGYPPEKISFFDYQAVLDQLRQPLELRKIDYHKYPIFAIIFAQTRADEYGELDTLLHSDLKEFAKIH